MPDELRAKLEGKCAIHSAAAAYSREGGNGDSDVAARSMDIRPSDEAKPNNPILSFTLIRRRAASGFLARRAILWALKIWSRPKLPRSSLSFIAGKPSANFTTAINGKKTCSSCGIIAACSTWPQAAIRVMTGSCTARRLGVFELVPIDVM